MAAGCMKVARGSFLDATCSKKRKKKIILHAC